MINDDPLSLVHIEQGDLDEYKEDYHDKENTSDSFIYVHLKELGENRMISSKEVDHTQINKIDSTKKEEQVNFRVDTISNTGNKTATETINYSKKPRKDKRVRRKQVIIGEDSKILDGIIFDLLFDNGNRKRMYDSRQSIKKKAVDD